jgi:hypothetical protein
MRVADDRQARAAETGLHGITGVTGAWLEIKPSGARYPFWRGSLNGKRITIPLNGDSVAHWRKQAKLIKAKRDHGESAARTVGAVNGATGARKPAASRARSLRSSCSTPSAMSKAPTGARR